MADAIHFDQVRLPEAAQALRREVRAFLADEIAAGTFDPRRGVPTQVFDAGFSRKVGARGWIGMTWPKRYGGAERSFLERYVVTEEFRIANAPVGLHFTADRQSGPMLLRYGSERIKAEIWTTAAHRADYMIGLFRTSPRTRDDRRFGLTQFLVDMRAPGITVSPIRDMSGRREFDEVAFDDALVPDDHVLGEIDGAWKQATSELAYERSGPERFLEIAYLVFELVRVLGEAPDARGAEGIGRMVAQLHALRRMSVSVAGMLEAGQEPTLEGSIVKDLGTTWQQSLPPRVRDLAAFAGTGADREVFDLLLDYATLAAPKLTIQGGTTEILRGIIARGLGLR